jgi:hypothetical protein
MSPSKWDLGWIGAVRSGLGGLDFAPKCPQFCPQAIFTFLKDMKKPRNSLNYGAFLCGGEIGI